MSTTPEDEYPHGSVGEEAALLAAAIEDWVRSAKESFGPLLTTALGAAASKAAGFANGAAAAAGAAAAGATAAGGAFADATAEPLVETSPGAAGDVRAADERGDRTGWAADGLLGRIHAAVGSAQPGHAGECRYCPICRILATLRGPRSEVMDHLVEAGSSLLAALRAAIDSHERSWAGAPPAPVQHIDIL